MNKFEMLYEAVMEKDKLVELMSSNNNFLKITFTPTPDVVRDVKSLHTSEYKGGYWTAPASRINVEALESFGFTIRPEVKARLAEKYKDVVRSVTVEEEADGYWPAMLRVEFNPPVYDIVRDIKTLEGRQFKGKYWTVPATRANIARLEVFGFEIPDEVKNGKPEAAPEEPEAEKCEHGSEAGEGREFTEPPVKTSPQTAWKAAEWEIDGEPVSNFKLLYRLGYKPEECGCWTRPAAG